MPRENMKIIRVNFYTFAKDITPLGISESDTGIDLSNSEVKNNTAVG